MPYIITTHARLTQTMPGPTTRIAVATLDEAREAAYSAVEDREPPIMVCFRLAGECHDMSESGGTIGPLPDGTVIEVKPCTWSHLAKVVKWDNGPARPLAEILAAFNAA
jgi:hypothetical protein